MGTDTSPIPWPRTGRSAVRQQGDTCPPTGRLACPLARGKSGTKYHLLTDRNGLPLHVLVSAANTHDSKLFEPLLETNPAVRGRRGRPGRPRRRPEKLHADSKTVRARCSRAS